MTFQLDLFARSADEPIGSTKARLKDKEESAPRSKRVSRLSAREKEADYVHRLEGTGRYRILQKLVPRPLLPRSKSAFPRLGLCIDTETTGLDSSKDEIIELGMIAFTYNDQGELGDVVAVFNALRQPYRPIPTEITKLTGITNEMVAGKTIDPKEVEDFIAPADLVIAHNARFDRPFCERLSAGFSTKPWACSNSEVAWADYGFEGTKLAYLIGQCGFFHDGHRAIDDCHALIEVLARAKGNEARSAFGELLENSKKAVIRIWAENSPFDMKEKLKSRHYRWSDGSNGQPKAWWTDVSEADLAEELRFLRQEIFQWEDADPPIKRLTACDRFKTSA